MTLGEIFIWAININLICLPEAIIKICLQDKHHSFKSGIPLEAQNLRSGKNHATHMLANNPYSMPAKKLWN